MQYFPLVKIRKRLHYNCINMHIVGYSKNKKHLRGSTQATIHPLPMHHIYCMTAAWGLGEFSGPHSYCLLCVSYIKITTKGVMETNNFISLLSDGCGTTRCAWALYAGSPNSSKGHLGTAGTDRACGCGGGGGVEREGY